MQKYLIVGLGNIGEKYLQTRHNIGFLVADSLAARLGTVFSKKNFGSLAQAKYKGRPIFILKPDTYMNLSGKAVKYWANKENISLEHILILTDDLNLMFGDIRLRGKGSDGGHNGLKSIQQDLQTSQYARLRIGIGKEFSAGEQINYVLGTWTESEKKELPAIIDKCVDAALSFCFVGIDETMNLYNR